MTLTELLVVVAVMTILLGISVPVAQRLMSSFESSTGVRHLINAALSNARAIAVRQQAYAGVRFQQDKDGHTYMIFIIHDPSYDPTKAPEPLGTGLANGFRAVTGRKPMQLPEDVGVLANVFLDSNTNAQNDALVDTAAELTNASTFSVVFTPQGKLVMHEVQVRNKDGRTDSTSTPTVSNDTIFNVLTKVNTGIAQFYQDDYPNPDIPANPNLGYPKEDSVQNLIVFSKKQLAAVADSKRWTGYFSNRDVDYISPYTGELIIEAQE